MNPSVVELMSTETTIEGRVRALEEAVAEIRRGIAPMQASPHWIEAFKGAFRDDPDFAEAMRLGREFRATGVVPGGDEEGEGERSRSSCGSGSARSCSRWWASRA